MNFQDFLTPGWIGLSITLVGFLTYYLGRVVMDYYVSKEDEAMNHVTGSILLLLYFVIPAFLFYTFNKYIILDLNIRWFLFFMFFSGLIIIYFRLKHSIFEIKRGRSSGIFFKLLSERLSSFGILLDKKNFAIGFFSNLPSQWLVMFWGYVLIFLVANIIIFLDYWFLRVFFIVGYISTLNHVMILHVAEKIIYPKVEITDILGKKHKGSLIKQDLHYIILNDGKNLFSFPRENVIFVKNFLSKNIYKKIDEIKEINKRSYKDIL